VVGLAELRTPSEKMDPAMISLISSYHSRRGRIAQYYKNKIKDKK